MPRFYFEVHEGTSTIDDDEGVELATVADAQIEGAVALARMLADAIRKPVDRTMFILIRDEARSPLCRVTLSLAVTLH